MSEQVCQLSRIQTSHRTKLLTNIALTVNFDVTMGRNVILRIKNVMAKANHLEEAVDILVKAALTADQPFPEASYEVLHDHCGGLDLLIGTRHGKCSLVFCRYHVRRNQCSQYFSQQYQLKKAYSSHSCKRRKN